MVALHERQQGKAGGEPMPMTPDDFSKYIAAETTKWAKVIKFAGIKVK